MWPAVVGLRMLMVVGTHRGHPDLIDRLLDLMVSSTGGSPTSLSLGLYLVIG